MRIAGVLIFLLCIFQNSFSYENKLDLAVKGLEGALFTHLEDNVVLNKGESVYTFFELTEKIKGSLLIHHPPKFTLFINNTLYYSSNEEGTFSIPFEKILSVAKQKEIILESYAPIISNENLTFTIEHGNKIMPSKMIVSPTRENRTQKFIYYASIFLLLTISSIRFYSKKNFEFYFKGAYLLRHKFWNDRFAGESINPIYVSIGLLCMCVFVLGYIGISDSTFGLGNFKNDTFREVYLIGSVVAGFLLFTTYKFIAYWFHTLLIGERRQFSVFVNNFILNFTNTAFFLFLIFAIQLFIFRHLESQAFFRFIFFIFAALNVLGSSRVYLKALKNNTAVTLCSMLLIEFIPVISLLKVLS